jgi:hypothetical protein
MRFATIAVSLAVASCAPAAPCPAASPPPPPGATPMPPEAVQPVATPKAEDREKVAVLPFEDEELFRDERTSLRAQLAASIQKALPDHDIVPLVEVDAKIRPVSKSGARCAFDGTPVSRRASGNGWLTTSLMHVLGFKDQPEQLWVELSDWQGPKQTLAAPWDPKLDRVARYQRAMSVLAPLPGAGALGGLAGTFTPKGEVTVGELTLCQRHGFRDCVPETKLFTDRAQELAACFTGVDEERRMLIFDGAKRCEIEDLNDTTGLDGKREACLCAAFAKSAGATASKGRWRLALHYEAKDIVGKPRPEIRAVEASTNLHAEDDWHSMRHEEAGKSRYTSVRRLVVDNLDAARPALARCALPAGSLIMADVTLSEVGNVTESHVLSGAKTKRDSACVEKALSRGTFDCTNDGKPASLRVTLEWPKAAAGH